MATSKKQKTVVVGAGPVGSLAALYAAKRGDDVELYELRGDLRDPSTTPLNFTKSINLALSERGINSMKKADCPGLLESVLNETIPMHGRMIHGQKHGNLFQEPQLYDVHGRFVRAVDRAGLNKSLLDELEKMPNVKFFFNHKLTGADFRKNLAWFERQGILRSDIAQNQTQQPADKRGTEIEVKFDFMIGADGAHSAVRYHLMKYTRMSYQQEYIDALWCEFHISPTKDNDFMLPPNYLHIWSGEEFMFIAIPSLDKSFTSTLFLPNTRFADLDANQSSLTGFFKLNFPGVIPNLISEAELHKQYSENPHLPLISIKCTPYHYGSSVVILGDAAHAMVPFYGQGMNAGLEDVRVLFDILDEYSVGLQNSDTIRGNRAKALEEYTKQRTPDAVAINDLALRNYQEMRSDVRSPMYRLRKWTEEKLDAYLPSLGWATQYSRVSFGNNRYSEVEKATRRQGRILLGVMGLSLVSAFGLGSLWLSRLNSKFPPGKFLSQWFHGLFGKLTELKSR